MIWVISANTNTCRIYDYQKLKSLNCIKEIQHPESKLKISQLVSDRNGHYQGGESTRGAYAPHTDIKDVEKDKLAREIAQTVDAGRNTHAFDELVVIAEPHMNGLLFQHFNKHVKELVINNFKKDLHALTQDQLLDFLKTNTRYRNGS